MTYYMIETLGDLDGDWAVIDDPPEDLGPIYFRPAQGKRVGDDYPDDVGIRTSQVYTDIRLGSLIGNTVGYLIVTGQVREVIEAHCAGVDIEFLPFTLYNHKGRERSRDFVIVNPIGTFDCLNLTASEIKWFDKPGDRYHGSVVSIDRYVLDPARLENAPALFRVKEDPDKYVISEALAADLRKRGCTNLVLEELDQVPVPPPAA